MKVVYTHDEAAAIVELFEDVLDQYNIKIPSPEDDERGSENEAKLYGSTYGELLNAVEIHIIDLLARYVGTPGFVAGEFSGNY